jgi:ketosteroid isomerase-like protein
MTLEEKERLVRQVFASLADRDVDTVLTYWDPDGVFDFSRSRGVNPGVYRRHAGLRKFYAETVGMWEKWEADPHDFADLGDDGVLVTVDNHMVGRDGIALDVTGVGWVTFRDGHLHRWVFFQSREDAEAEIAKSR